MVQPPAVIVSLRLCGYIAEFGLFHYLCLVITRSQDILSMFTFNFLSFKNPF